MKRIRVEEIDGVIFIDGVDIIKTIGKISKEADRLKIENQKQKEVIEDIKKELLERNILDILPFDVAEKLCYLLKEVSE